MHACGAKASFACELTDLVQAMKPASIAFNYLRLVVSDAKRVGNPLKKGMGQVLLSTKGGGSSTVVNSWGQSASWFSYMFMLEYKHAYNL